MLFNKITNKKKETTTTKISKKEDKIYNYIIENIDKDLIILEQTKPYFYETKDMNLEEITYTSIKKIIEKVIRYCKQNNIVKLISFSYTNYSINGKKETRVNNFTIKSINDMVLDYINKPTTKDSVINFITSDEFFSLSMHNRVFENIANILSYFDFCKYIKNIDLNSLKLQDKQYNNMKFIKSFAGITSLKGNWTDNYTSQFNNIETYLTIDYTTIREKISSLLNIDHAITVALLKETLKKYDVFDIMNHIKDPFNNNNDIPSVIDSILLEDDFLIEKYPELINYNFLLLYSLVNRTVINKCYKTMQSNDRAKFVTKLVKYNPNLWNVLSEDLKKDKTIAKIALNSAIDKKSACIFDIIKNSELKIDLKECLKEYLL